MLQGELFIKRLATDLSLEVEQSLELWRSFVSILTCRLVEGRAVDMAQFGKWSLELRPEFVAQSEGGSYLVPPSISLSLSEVNRSHSYEGYLAFAESLSETVGVALESVRSWLQLIPGLSLQLLEAGQQVQWQGVGLWSLSGEVLCLSLDEGLAERFNKPFEGFKPELLEDTSSLTDVEHRPLSLEEATQYQREYRLPLLRTTSEVVEEVQGDSIAAPQEGLTEDDDEIAVTVRCNDSAKTVQQVELAKDNEIEVVGDTAESLDENKQPNKKRFIWLWLLLGGIVLLLVWLFRLQTRGHAQELPHQDAREAEHRLSSRGDTVLLPRDTLGVVGPPQLEEETQLKSEEPKAQAIHRVEEPETHRSKIQVDQTPAISAKQSPEQQVREGKPSSKPSKGRQQAEEIELSSGESLATLSQRKYGHKAFWVYIYEENRERIPNPHNIPIGTKLHLPAAEKYGIDPNNTKSLNQALILSRSL